MLLAVHENQHHEWDGVAQFISGRASPPQISPAYAAAVPAWLPLPLTHYTFVATTGGSGAPIGIPSVLIRGWINDSSLYLGGTIRTSGQLTPSEGTSIGGHRGQMAVIKDVVVFLIPLSEDQTYLFVGTGTPTLVSQYAEAMLNHLDVLPTLHG